MMRSLAFLLTLAVVFLVGIVIGIDRDKQTETNTQETIQLSEVTFHENMSEESDENYIFIETPLDSSEHFTQKAASFLESGVKVFYNTVVEVLYHISSLVF